MKLVGHSTEGWELRKYSVEKYPLPLSAQDQWLFQLQHDAGLTKKENIKEGNNQLQASMATLD